jgi:hypothetical protein
LALSGQLGFYCQRPQSQRNRSYSNLGLNEVKEIPLVTPPTPYAEASKEGE